MLDSGSGTHDVGYLAVDTGTEKSAYHRRARREARPFRATSPLLGERVQTVGIVASGLMVWAGQVKQIPPLSSLPVDFTIAMTGLALICGLLYNAVTHWSIRRDPLAIVVLLVCCGVFGSVNYVANDYATDKTLRFFVLTWPSMVAIAMLVRDQNDTRRFLRAVVAVSLVLSLFIAFAGEREYDENLGRLVTADGGTILFGQACGAVAIAVLAWLLTSGRVTPVRLVAAGGLIAFEVWTMLAIASKGPIQALVLGSMAMVALQFRRLSPATTVRILGIGVVLVAAFVAVWSRVPLWSRERILEFASGNSAGSRLRAWSFTWSSLSATPFGHGWGSWDQASPIRIGYPHNILLEIWYEAGLLGLIVLLAAVAIATARLLDVFDFDRALATLGLGLMSFWFFAAQVSSDINGNKLLLGMLVATAAPVAYSRLSGRDGPYGPAVGSPPSSPPASLWAPRDTDNGGSS